MTALNLDGEWMVRLVHDTDESLTHEMGPFDYRKAERVASGAAINLDWENWSIETRKVS